MQWRRVRQRPYLQLRGRPMRVVDPIGEAPRLEELLVHGSLVTEQVEAYPLEDSLVDHPEHRQVNLEVRLLEYIW